jgi:hypothetical protein
VEAAGTSVQDGASVLEMVQRMAITWGGVGWGSATAGVVPAAIVLQLGVAVC